MLAKLPFEILAQIVKHVEHAQTLLHLSLTCKWLYEFTEKEAFRIFVQSRFPSIQTPPFWKDAAHALTTCSRSWDYKAFIARSIEPSAKAIRLPLGGSKVEHGRRQRGQTMGYQPVIDSYEEWYGSSWSSRKEILAWGAGAELALRVRSMGDEAEKSWQKARKGGESLENFDQHHHKVDWIVYKENGQLDGRDDITSINLLRPSQTCPSLSVHVIVGRSSGGLEYVELDKARLKSTVRATYTTNGRSVRTADVSSSEEPLLAACLSDSALAIYPIHSGEKNVRSLGEVLTLPYGTPGRTWSTKFLSRKLLAVGLGPSPDPIHIYQLKQDGVSKEPIRKFGAYDNHHVDMPYDLAPNSCNTSSVYPIEPLASSSQASGGADDVFLSGWYDGVVRLHDLRSPAASTAMYTDPIDNDSAIYSLLSLGRERFIAGGARHSTIKIFDLRMSGGKVYHALDLDSCSSEISRTPPTPAPETVAACCNYHYEMRHDRRNWNLFLHPRGPTFYRLGTRRSVSPVYALSAPSASSPSLYAGIENSVVQFDIVSMMDRHPDPIFKYGTTQSRSRDCAIRMKWDPQKDVMRLAMYEQVPMASMRLRVQSGVGDMSQTLKGWDERWVDGRGYY